MGEPSRRRGRRHLHTLNVFLLTAATLVLFVSVIAAATTVRDEQKQQELRVNATEPLIYNRLRYDHSYLQLFHKYQRKYPYEERPIVLKVNQTLDDNKTREIVYTYYQNDEIESGSITRDDLILEALDRTYKSRLFPFYIYNYDNPEDRKRASDPNIFSRKKCNQDLDYLMDKVAKYEQAQINGHNLAFEPELAAYFDSFATEEPGLLFGNYHWTGNWRQCKKRLIFDRLNPSNIIGFSGRYCIASIKSRIWEPKIKEKVDELLKDGNYFKYPEQQYDYARFFRIQVGICLPESCDSQTVDLRRHDIHRLTVLRLNEPFKEYKLVDLFCLPDETSEFRRIELSGWLLLTLMIIWCLSVIIITLIDYIRKANNQRHDGGSGKRSRRDERNALDKLVSAMSLIENYRRITEIKSLRAAHKAAKEAAKKASQSRGNNRQTPEQSNAEACGGQQNGGKVLLASERKLSPSDMIFMNFFKAISMPMIICGHVGLLGQHLNRFPLDFESLEYPLIFHGLNSGVFLVDWYFVITGFVTTYTLFVTKKVERYSLVRWIHSIFHRYWRLAPLYILIFWFSRSLFQHTGSGPVWDYGANNMTIRAICRRESWLWPLTLTSNFHPLHEECVMPSWYIANDMQFYLITPFILICLSKWPLVGWLMTITMIGSCILARIHRYSTDPRAQPLELLRPRYDLHMRNNWDMHPTYLYPQYRISSYLIGILAGHYTYMVLSGQWRSPIYFNRSADFYPPNKSSKRSEQISLILRTLAWSFGLLAVSSMTIATWILFETFPPSLEPLAKYFTPLIYGCHHAYAGIGVSLLFVTFMLGQFPHLKAFLSHPIWTLISRLNYFVFLIQVELIYWLQQSGKRAPDTSARLVLKGWLQVTFLCYLLSAIITIVLEYPLANLEREFIDDWVNKKFERQPKPHGHNGGAKDSASQELLQTSLRQLHQGQLVESPAAAPNQNSTGDPNKRLDSRQPFTRFHRPMETLTLDGGSLIGGQTADSNKKWREQQELDLGAGNI